MTLSPEPTRQTGIKDSLLNIFGTAIGLGAIAYDAASCGLTSLFGREAPESEKSPLLIVRLVGFDHE